MKPSINLSLLSAVCMAIGGLHAQSQNGPDWQTAAGGKMAFEVRSKAVRFDIIAQTGLTGPFEVMLEWSPDDGVAPAADIATPGPSIFTAVQQQLGLRLESRKGPLDVLVIDHAEKVPAEN